MPDLVKVKNFVCMDVCMAEIALYHIKKHHLQLKLEKNLLAVFLENGVQFSSRLGLFNFLLDGSDVDQGLNARHHFLLG
jgi:hypothetical protein